MKKQSNFYDFMAMTAMLLYCLYVLSACLTPQRTIQLEQFGIYHISSKQDTTFLNWDDLKVLQIDSLEDKHLELNAER